MVETYVRCPFCDSEYFDDKACAWHVFAMHLSRYGSPDGRRCWCDFLVPSSIRFAQHIRYRGGLIEHYLLHQFGADDG
jgi:hypothetical protein